MIPQLTGDSSSKVDRTFSPVIYPTVEKVDPIQLIFFMCSRHDFSAIRSCEWRETKFSCRDWFLMMLEALSDTSEREMAGFHLCISLGGGSARIERCTFLNPPGRRRSLIQPGFPVTLAHRDPA